MPIPSIYLNLEDDVSKIMQRVKREKALTLVLVCPKRCFLFNDSINLRLLKKQVDLLGKEAYILTMDELGQMYAKEAGFKLKFLSSTAGRTSLSDIRVQKSAPAEVSAPKKANPQQVRKPAPENIAKAVSTAVAGIKNLVHTQPPQIQTQVSMRRPAVTDSVYHEITKPEYEAGEQKPKEKRHFFGFHTFALTLVTLSLILVILTVFVILPKASVAVYPKTEPITRDWDISLSGNTHAPDSNTMALPATSVAQVMDEQNKFQAQGKMEIGNKAQGTVQIYNFTKELLNLKASTTLLALGGQEYLLTQDISGIRPTTYKNAVTKEVDPASLSAPVQVIAQNGGDSYNVPAGTRIEISNQVFGSRPQLLFAKTVDSITGGTSRFLSTVSAQDINSAQNALADQALKDLRAKLATQNLILADKSFVVENLGFTTDQPVNTQVPNFNATLKAKITGLAFSMVDLQKLITDRVGQTLAANETLEIKNPEQQITYTVQTVDLNTGTATISIHFEGNAVMNVNLSDVTSQLVGKGKDQVNEILLSKAEIDKVEITLAPSWQKNFPMFASKINVYVVKNTDTSSDNPSQ